MKLIFNSNGRMIATATDDYSGEYDTITVADNFEHNYNYCLVDGELVLEVPQSITKVQAMRAMKQTDVDEVAGTTMWTAFQALLASNEDANDEWILALDLVRNHPLVLALTPALGKTSTQIDELFILARSL